jgi:septal ring factor EnvC (AmiA/AmiB activator)
MNRFIVIVILILIFSSATAHAQEDEPEAIESLSAQKQVIDSLLEVKHSEVEQLYLLDEQLDLTSNLVRKLERNVRTTNRELRELSVSIDSSKVRLEKMKSSLAGNLRSFYLNYQPAPAAIFSAGDIQKAARQLTYFKSTANYIKTQIDSINLIQSELELKQVQLIDMKSETEKLVLRKNVEESMLEMRKKEKSRLLARIDADVDLRSQYLEEAQKNQEELSDLTRQLRSESYVIDFETLRGKLMWPARGKIIRHFGKEYDKLTSTETFSPGIEINIPSGTQIAAAAGGTIAHAGYLRGYGSMVIIDHGGGWYTLYGHLSRISGTLGDKVERGDIIGYSGESGSNIGPSLFFGIRHRDQSFDPVEWLG